MFNFLKKGVSVFFFLLISKNYQTQKKMQGESSQISLNKLQMFKHLFLNIQR